MNNTSLLLDSLDNVGVALCDLSPGDQVSLELHSLEISQFIPANSKNQKGCSSYFRKHSTQNPSLFLRKENRI